MIFNFTNNHQFTIRVNIDDVKLEVIDNTKLLGTHITSDLKWDLNTINLIKKANARMQLLRKLSTFGASTKADPYMCYICQKCVRSFKFSLA